MISHVLLAAMLASPNAALIPARNAYSKCLTTLMRTDLKEKVDAAAFEAKLATACKAEEAAFRAASIAADVAVKIARATADRNASDEIGYIRENTVENYKGYLETDTSPR